MARLSSPRVALGSLRASVLAVSSRTKPWSRMTPIWVRTATASEMPRTVRQCVRMVETAPSRISPTPSGRSGITPGLAAGGGPPQLPPQPGVPCPGGAVAGPAAGRRGAGGRGGRPSPGRAAAVAGSGRGPAGWGRTTGRAGGCSLDHFGPAAAAGPRRCWSAGCVGGAAGRRLRGARRSGSCPSEGADPGEAQPGVSFIVAPSRCPSAVAAAGWQPSCHAVLREVTGGRMGCAPSIVRRIRGRLTAWLISTRNPATDNRPTGIPAIRWDEPPEGPVLPN